VSDQRERTAFSPTFLRERFAAGGPERKKVVNQLLRAELDN